MSDRVLQHVLADLRPLLATKLKIEASIDGSSDSQGTVDVHRGDSYQFAYFFRKAEPHSVLIKTRNFVAAPAKPPIRRTAAAPTESANSKRRVRPKKSQNQDSSTSKKAKTKGKQKAVVDVPSDSSDGSGDDAPHQATPRRSARSRKAIFSSYREEDIDEELDDVVMADVRPRAEEGAAETVTATSDSLPAVKEEEAEASLLIQKPSTDNDAADTIDLDIEEEEEKPKPLLQLRYQNFSIYGRCLCVVVEPWPRIRDASRAPSVAPIFSGAAAAPRGVTPGIAPPGDVMAGRARTPLFLPDEEEDEIRGSRQTPAPFPMTAPRVLPPVPLFSDVKEEDDEEDSLMLFSQVLNSTGEIKAGEAEDVDDEEDAVLFGDADEVREL